MKKNKKNSDEQTHYIDDTFQLIIGGSGNTEETPMYIRLALKENWDTYIDIRTEDVQEFIDTHSK